MRLTGGLLCGLLLAGSAMAQTPPAAAPAEPSEAASAEAGGEPTVSITAHVQASSITVRQRGRTEAHIWSRPGGEGTWKFDRHGIPNPIPVGKTFHDVALDLDAHADVTDQGLTVGASAKPGEMQQPAAPPGDASPH